MKLFNLSQISEISESKLSGEEESHEKISFNCLVHLVRVPDKMFYEGCSFENCKKKVTKEGSQYYCPNCGSSESFKPRFLCKLKFCDYSGELWINCIGDRDFF